MTIKTGTSYKLAASLICGNPLALMSEVRELEQGRIDGIHFDVMDGQFVPRLGLYPEYLRAVKEATQLPVDIHLMIEDPGTSIPAFIKAGVTESDVIVIHAESTKHLHYVVKSVRDAGYQAGVALNPATPLSALDYVLPELERVMLMAINPGIVGHKLIPDMIRKISELKVKLTDYPQVRIQVDGGVSPESAASMVLAGADILVCGTSAIYKKDRSLVDTITEFRAGIDKVLASSN
jgi:ribulose-phosphate 3-epimerase